MKKLIFDYTTFILVITNDNGINKYFISDSYDKCYQYMLKEYFDGDESYLKECELHEDNKWKDNNCWTFCIEMGKTL